MVRTDPFNAETPRAALAGERTASEEFFVRSHFAIPRPDPTRWRLRVGGAVERPQSWTLAELRRLPQRRLAVTLECAGNGRDAYAVAAPGELRWGECAVGSALWEGVPLSTLLEASGLRPSAREVVFQGADGAPRGAPAGPSRFARSLHLDVPHATSDVLVATQMNDRPLAAEHGFPARLVVPGWYGMAWVKWLTSITARATPFQGHFQSTKYVYRTGKGASAEVRPVTQLRVKSLVVAPEPGATVPRGRPVRVSGRAWSGAGAVRTVDVDVGDGWRPARVVPGTGAYAWAGWSLDWIPTRPGPVTIRSRATDASGAVQPEEPFENEHQYGSNSVRAVEVHVQ